MTDEQLALAKTVPAIAGATIYGLTLQDWVAIATLVYVALQVGLLMPKVLEAAARLASRVMAEPELQGLSASVGTRIAA